MGHTEEICAYFIVREVVAAVAHAQDRDTQEKFVLHFY